MSLCTLVACGGAPVEAEEGDTGEGESRGSADEASEGASEGASEADGSGSEAEAESSQSSGDGDGDGVSTGSESETDTGDCDCGEQICTPEGCVSAQLFINFDGPVLIGAYGEDATLNSTHSSQFQGQMLPYGDDEVARQAVVDEVRTLIGNASVYVTSERPEYPPYTMVVVGPNLEDWPSITFAYRDCDDAMPNDLAWVHADLTDDLTPAVEARLVARVFGYTHGFDQVVSEADIMGQNLSASTTFVDACLPLVNANGSCAPQHISACPNGGQNARAELESW